MKSIEDIQKHNELQKANIAWGFGWDGYDLQLDNIEKARKEGEASDKYPGYVWTKRENGTFGWRKPKAETKEEKQGEKEPEKKQSDVTVKQIFSNIQSLNPSTSTISSIGTFVSSQNQQIADDKVREIMGFLPKDSLAYKIITSADKFTDKQLWVISFELEKNDKYKKHLSKEIQEFEEYQEYQRNRKSAKRAAKSQRKKEQKVQEKKNLQQFEEIDSDQKVRHPIFGEGKVLSQTEDKIKVFFKERGEKELLKKYTKLEKI
jgi:hypothetical protein